MTKARAVLVVSSMMIASFGAHAENVGNVGAVNQSAHGTPLGAGARALSVGSGVQNRERIETRGEGSAQIVFKDTSTMTIGRNSAVTIDHFVYNSSAGAGSQGLSMAKGVMRFVGGGVSHESGARLRTPTASIGVRGGTVMVEIGGACGTLVVLQFGVSDVAGRNNSQTLTRSGWGVCAPPGGPVSEPFQVDPATLARLMALLSSGANQWGGALDPPRNYDANLRLGQIRQPDVVEHPGLEALIPSWTGNAIVFSRTVSDNQPSFPSTPQEPPPTDTVIYDSGPDFAPGPGLGPGQ